MAKENEKATPEEEALANTAEIPADRKKHYAEMNERSVEERENGNVG